MPKHLFIIIVMTALICWHKGVSGQSNTANKNIAGPHTARRKLNSDSLKIRLKMNINLFANSLLKSGRAVMQDYLAKYQPGSCGIVCYKNNDLRKGFEGVRVIKGIIGSKRTDRVFVVPPFNHCDEGESYCFYNKALPRLLTKSYCCHPGNLFVLPDIDEDGIREIGIYYSSCTSRFKSLKIYSLKRGQWKEIGSSIFDTFMRDPRKIQFSRLVKKVAKNKFKLCNLMDGKAKWQAITIK